MRSGLNLPRLLGLSGLGSRGDDLLRSGGRLVNELGGLLSLFGLLGSFGLLFLSRGSRGLGRHA